MRSFFRGEEGGGWCSAYVFFGGGGEKGGGGRGGRREYVVVVFFCGVRDRRHVLTTNPCRKNHPCRPPPPSPASPGFQGPGRRSCGSRPKDIPGYRRSYPYDSRGYRGG